MDAIKNALTDNQKGAMVMTATNFTFVTTDFAFQSISGELPLPQFLFLRGILVTFGLLLLAKMSRRAFPKARKTQMLMILRGCTEIYVAFAFLTCLAHLPLQEATAINQTVPLVMTIAAYFVFGERFGIWRFGAIVVGFIGVLFIIKPGFAEFNPYYLLNISVVVAITVRDLLAKQMPRDVASVWVAFVTVFLVTIFNAGLSVFVEWRAVDMELGTTIILIAIGITAGQFLMVSAMRLGEVNVVAPFRYSALLFAVIYDVLLLKANPDALTLLGCVLVSSAGIVTLVRAPRRA